jgi:hypothetical protein
VFNTAGLLRKAIFAAETNKQQMLYNTTGNIGSNRQIMNPNDDKGPTKGYTHADG